MAWYLPLNLQDHLYMTSNRTDDLQPYQAEDLEIRIGYLIHKIKHTNRLSISDIYMCDLLHYLLEPDAWFIR